MTRPLCIAEAIALATTAGLNHYDYAEEAAFISACYFVRGDPRVDVPAAVAYHSFGLVNHTFILTKRAPWRLHFSRHGMDFKHDFHDALWFLTQTGATRDDFKLAYGFWRGRFTTRLWVRGDEVLVKKPELHEMTRVAAEEKEFGPVLDWVTDEGAILELV